MAKKVVFDSKMTEKGLFDLKIVSKERSKNAFQKIPQKIPSETLIP